MHMTNALISPAVGGTMWAVSGGLVAYCLNKLRQAPRAGLVSGMGVLAAFVFAAQMINFSIPGTGSSGHLCGGLMLAALLGPHAAFLTMASVLTVQSLFFADGGLLALGCNVFNMGFFPAFVAYPLICRVVAGERSGGARAWLAAVAGAVVALQLGAFGVVLATKTSGISVLPFRDFLPQMLPIHLAIGVVEGLATAAVVSLAAHASAESPLTWPGRAAPASLRPVLLGLSLGALLMGGVASWFASTHPDGLEWAIARVSGEEELQATDSAIHKRLDALQARTALLPDYAFRPASQAVAAAAAALPRPRAWPAVSAGTSVAGLVGGLLTFALACLAGFALRVRSIQRAHGNRWRLHSY